MQSKYLSGLGIYPDAIANNIEKCESILNSINLNKADINRIHEDAIEMISERDFNPDVFTDNIIQAYFSATKGELQKYFEEKFPDKTINILDYANVDDSHIYIDVDGETTELFNGNDLTDIIDTFEENYENDYE